METKSKNRDDYFRCKICFGLFEHEKCIRDRTTGVYICPIGCVRSYDQPEYESPLLNDL